MTKKQLEQLKEILTEYIRDAEWSSKSHTAEQILKTVERMLNA